MHKYVNLADLVKSFPTSIYLQTSASIQPRTSLKFGGDSIHIFNSLLRQPAAPATGPGGAADFFAPLTVPTADERAVEQPVGTPRVGLTAIREALATAEGL